MPTFALTIGLTEPIGEWRTLVNAIKNWCNRDDWSDEQVTEFIALAEARLNRELRVPDMEAIATTTLLAGDNDLPADFMAMRAIFAEDRELYGMSITELVRQYGNYGGYATAYALLGSNPRKIRLGAQQDTLVTIVYYQKIVGVNEENADNWLLNEHPDLYLYGSLLAAEAYIANDDRLPLWKSAYDEALFELKNAGVRDQYGSAPLRPRGTPQVRGARA